MKAHTLRDRSVHFGDYVLDLENEQLHHNGHSVKLQSQPLKLLSLLASRAGEIVTREDIQKELWRGETVVDFDKGIYYCIKEIRLALGDDADQPRFVETVPRRGYRFLITPEPIGDSQRASRVGSGKRWTVALCATVLLAVGALSAWIWSSRTNRESYSSPRVSLVTALPGLEKDPALSPDGKHVAFVWNGNADNQFLFHLYVKMIGGGERLQLTHASAYDYSPAWSPDGRQIAFLRETEQGSEVLVVPAMGGAERRLGTIFVFDERGGGWTPGLAWSPDGRFLAVVDKESTAQDKASIYLLSTETGGKRRLTFPPVGAGVGDGQPAFSPDGRSLVFLRRNQILQIPMDGGKPVEILSGEAWIGDVDWTPDGHFLIYAGGSSLWRAPVTGGDPISIPHGVRAVSVSRGEARLVSQQLSTPTGDIWRIGGPSSSQRDPTRFISSSRLDWAPRYSPDGTKIAFASWRAGTVNLWVCNSEGNNCNQLSEVQGILPRWSLDSRRIVFQCRFESIRDICITDVEGGFSQRLTVDEANDNTPSWSRDGKLIYFASNRSGEFQIWKMPSDGGTPVQITRNGGKCPLESEDGRFIFYNDNEYDPSVWKLPTSGGDPSLVLEAGEVRNYRYWTLWGENIVYRHLDGSRIRMFNIQTKQFRTLATFPPEQSRMPFGVTVSPDGQWILVPIWEPEEGDIVLFENFY